MANNIQDEILRRFQDAAGKRSPSADRDPGDSRSTAIDTASPLRPEMDGAATPAGQNVEGGARTETQDTGGGATAGSVLTDVFESGFGVVPLVGELLGLFGGNSSSQPELLKYQMPSSISFTSAETGGGLSAAGYDQMGLPRMYDAAGGGGAKTSDGGTSGAAPVTGAGTTAGPGAAAPQITVSVQAMDSQSFLDHSSDIAQAVRSAMLSMSSINDVVNEL